MNSYKLISYINQWAHMRVGEIKWVPNNKKNKTWSQISHGETETEPNGSSIKIIKKRYMSMFTPNQQTSSNNQQKQEKRNLPFEANEKSTINIPENNPLQLGWPEISKLSFLLQLISLSSSTDTLPLAPEKSLSLSKVLCSLRPTSNVLPKAL